jgi:hypothetical protein
MGGHQIQRATLFPSYHEPACCLENAAGLATLTEHRKDAGAMTPYELELTARTAQEMVEKDPAHELHAVYLMLTTLLKHEADKEAELNLNRPMERA